MNADHHAVKARVSGQARGKVMPPCPGCSLCCRGCNAEAQGWEPEEHACDGRSSKTFDEGGEA